MTTQLQMWNTIMQALHLPVDDATTVNMNRAMKFPSFDVARSLAYLSPYTSAHAQEIFPNLFVVALWPQDGKWHYLMSPTSREIVSATQLLREHHDDDEPCNGECGTGEGPCRYCRTEAHLAEFVEGEKEKPLAVRDKRNGATMILAEVDAGTSIAVGMSPAAREAIGGKGETVESVNEFIDRIKDYAAKPDTTVTIRKNSAEKDEDLGTCDACGHSMRKCPGCEYVTCAPLTCPRCKASMVDEDLGTCDACGHSMRKCPGCEYVTCAPLTCPRCKASMVVN